MIQSAKSKMETVVSEFLGDLSCYPGWNDWQRSKARYVLATHPDFPDHDFDISPFNFSEPIKQKHEVPLQYLELVRAADALAETEYYFRRYPFRDLPVSRCNHIVNICEMYFSRFYQLCERLKKYLNALNTLATKTHVDVGNTIKQIKKTFDHELRHRNTITHHETFSSRETDLLWLYESQLQDSDQDLKMEVRYLYRQITRDWARRVRQKMEVVDPLIESVAKATLEIGDFDIKGDIEKLKEK